MFPWQKVKKKRQISQFANKKYPLVYLYKGFHAAIKNADRGGHLLT